MKCEDFEACGWELGCDGAESLSDPVQQAEIVDHANHCPRCAALQESWREAKKELRALRELTQDASAPLRVEMRLRQEFRTRHRTLKVRAAAVVTAWALAGAAVLVGAMSWWNWHIAQPGSVAGDARGAGSAPTQSLPNVPAEASVQSHAGGEPELIADNDAEEFTLLPGSVPQETGEGAVVRVRMQRGALGALGLPVNEARAGEWIQVDLYVGQDGQPQAVRLPQ
jgi:hypothetical protein